MSNKITILEKPTEIYINRDNENVSILSGKGDGLASVTSDNICITRNNKRKKNPDTSFIRKEPIGEPFNPRKRAKEDTVTDVEKYSLKKHLHIFEIR